MAGTLPDGAIYVIEFVFLIFVMVGIVVALDHFFPVPVEGETCEDNPAYCCKLVKKYAKYCDKCKEDS